MILGNLENIRKITKLSATVRLKQLHKPQFDKKMFKICRSQQDG